MKKYIALAFLLATYAHGQVSIQGSNVQIGGSAGGTIAGTVLTDPPGSQTVNNLSGTTTGFNSANNVLWADGFPGADICAKINAAQASVAGSSGNPNPSVLIMTSPGQHYAVTNQCIIANDSTFPYIHKVMLEFQGSTFIWNGASGTPPIMVLGENAGSVFDTGWIKGSGYAGGSSVTFTTSVAVPALILNSGRPGFGIIGMSFNGNNLATACYSLINTTATGGVGYDEQSAVEWNNFDGCPDGIAMHRAAGGSDSMDYSWLVGNHFQLESGNKGLHIYGDEGFGGLDVQGVHWSSNTNTGGGTGGPASTIYVEANSGMLSLLVDMAGEDTGGNGFYDIGGPGYVSYTGFIHSRASAGVVAGTSNQGCATTFVNKSGTTSIGCNWFVESPPSGRIAAQSYINIVGGQYIQIFGGNDNDAYLPTGFQLYNCLTGVTPGGLTAINPGVPCYSEMSWTPSLGVLFGKGWADVGGGLTNTAQLPTTQYGGYDIAMHNFAVTAPNLQSGTTLAAEFGLKTNQTGDAVYEYATQPFITSDLSTGVAVLGSPMTGSCSYTAGAAVTFHIVNGRVVSCN